MTELTRSSADRANWHGDLPRLSLLAFVGLLIVWIAIALAGGDGVGAHAHEHTRQTLVSVSLVAAGVAAAGLLPWALGVRAMTWLRALFMALGGNSGPKAGPHRRPGCSSWWSGSRRRARRCTTKATEGWRLRPRSSRRAS